MRDFKVFKSSIYFIPIFFPIVEYSSDSICPYIPQLMAFISDSAAEYRVMRFSVATQCQLFINPFTKGDQDFYFLLSALCCNILLVESI